MTLYAICWDFSSCMDSSTQYRSIWITPEAADAELMKEVKERDLQTVFEMYGKGSKHVYTDSDYNVWISILTANSPDMHMTLEELALANLESQ
jgi:hypothetical protein